MKVYQIIVGPLETNCYIVVYPERSRGEQGRRAVIVDPGDDAEKIIKVAEENDLRPKGILLTHAHFDHVGALEEIKNHFQIKLMSPSTSEVDGLEIIKTPGHTPDGVCLVNEKEGVIFSGDTLFKNSIGRTDFPGGDYEQIKKSLAKIMKYPDHFKVYPGHGPGTTIGEERKTNPFLK
ncbi:MBL fold metallo-hydrolase [Patescibacteria group bacterium]|nr:MBL fold metallo-hydrolase [Patescibacteria group bacterium]